MNYREFLNDFQKWRSENNYPKREECRDLFRKYRDSENKVTNPIFDYILKQDKPAMFLDGLFKKDSEISLLDKQLKESQPQRDYKTEIIDCMYNYVKENNYIPNFSIINNLLGFKANKYYNSEKDIIEDCKQKYPIISNYTLNEADFNNEYIEKTLRAIKSHNKFFVTTAVSGKKICSKLFKSIKSYIKHNNAICLVLPCADIANRKSVYNWQLPAELKTDDFYVVYNDTYLNDNIYISDIKVSAKQINPSSGLPQFTQDGSVIIASPKQDLKFIPNGMHNIPNAIMTSGAITENDYSNDAFMSQRLNKIAEYEHILGGIIVEIEDNKIFHFRQIQMGANGEIIDLGIKYDGNKTPVLSENPAIVLGDSHFGEHDEEVLESERDIINKLKIKDLVLHDVFTAESISHWNRNKFVTLAKNSKDNKLSLEDEANLVADKINMFSNFTNGNVYIVDSNHHRFLDRYLESGRYATDSKNTYYSLDIVKAMIEGEAPFEYMLKNKTKLNQTERIVFLKPDEEKKIYNVEVGLHGDRGANGSKGNLAVFRKAYKKSVSAHSHTPEIYRGAYCVGTSSKLDLNYVHGLSSWVHSCCVIYSNGTRQLINIIKNKDGNYTWKL